MLLDQIGVVANAISLLLAISTLWDSGRFAIPIQTALRGETLADEGMRS